VCQLPALRIYVAAQGHSNYSSRSERPGADRPNAEKIPLEFEINMLRCIFCGFCQEVCPEEAIFLQKDYSLTGLSREQMIYNKESCSTWAAPNRDPEMETEAGRGEGTGGISG
jgi:formate hydrogenlyase subunit 6/NADH:ubiquinone oxidoreductase subunit I